MHPDTLGHVFMAGELAADDVFVARLLTLYKWAGNNQQVLMVAGVVLTIGVVGALQFANSRQARDEAASTELEFVHQSIGIGDTEGAKVDLITFLDRFGGSAYEGEARLLLGQLYLETGDSEQALSVLGPLGSSPSAPIELQGATLLGAAYEQEERWSEAEDVYLSIASRSELDFQIVDALTAAARIRGDRGDAAGAIELYEEALTSLDEAAPERDSKTCKTAETRGFIPRFGFWNALCFISG